MSSVPSREWIRQAKGDVGAASRAAAEGATGRALPAVKLRTRGDSSHHGSVQAPAWLCPRSVVGLRKWALWSW